MSINICDLCFEKLWQSCQNEGITIAAGLNASSGYAVWIRDKWDNWYMGIVTTDGIGSFSIDFQNPPFDQISTNSFAGPLYIIASLSEDEPIAEMMTINGSQYPCVELSFFDLN
jgi:hypothetical protein